MSESSSPTAAEPGGPPATVRKTLLLILGFLALMAGLAVIYLRTVMVADNKLREAIAEADLLDPGWRIPDLEAKRAVVSDDQNSALVLLRARPLIPSKWPFWNAVDSEEAASYTQDELHGLKLLGGAFDSEFDPPARLTPLQVRVVRAEIRRAGRALEEMHLIADMPAGRYPITYAPDFIGTLLDHSQRARYLAIPFNLDVVRRTEDGDLPGAFRSWRAIINIGRSVGDEPTLGSALIRASIHAVAVSRLEWILAQSEPSDELLSGAQRLLEEEERQPLLLVGARGERAGIDGLLEAVQRGDIKAWELSGKLGSKGREELYSPEAIRLIVIPAFTKSFRADILRMNTRFVEIAKLPPEEQSKPLRELEAQAKERSSLQRLVEPVYVKVANACRRDRAGIRCAQAIIAAERHRRKTGHFPSTLEELVPAFLAKVPLDPFDGQPLRMRRIEDRLVIYSVSLNEKDDGGKLDAEHWQDADWGLRLWDVAQRRRQR
jgi:hypothetical protein